MHLTPARLAALILPLLLLGAVLGPMLRPLPVASSDKADAMDALLAETEPSVVLIGNSILDAGVDPEDLARGLGLPRDKVQILWLPGSPSYTWYLILKNRVYAHDHNPRLVIMASALPWFFQTDLDTDVAREGLAAMVGEHEPDIEAKIYGTSRRSAARNRFDTRRRVIRDGLSDGVRNLTAGLFFGDGEGSLMQQGQAVLKVAFEEVFEAEGATDIQLHTSMMPVAHMDQRASTDKVSLEASLIPEILDLAAEHDTRLVFVQIPRTAAKMKEEPVDASVVFDFVNAVNATSNATYLDLSGLRIPDTSFRDVGHMNERGKAQFTGALSAALQEIDALGDTPFPPVQPPLVLPFSAERTGDGPALPALSVTPGDGPCQLSADVAGLRAISDNELAEGRAFAVTPLLVYQDGRPLQRATRKSDLAGGCLGLYRHRSKQVAIAPSGDPQDALDHTYTLGLSPDLPQVAEGSEAWWVYPGTTLTLRFEGFPDQARKQALELWLEPLAGDGARVAVLLDGEALTPTRRGRLLRVATSRKAPKGAWTLEIRSPDSGPYALLRYLRVRDGERTADVIGSRDRIEPPYVSLLANGSFDTEPATPTLSLPLPDLAVEDGLATVALPEWAALSIDVVHQHLTCGKCSPLVVLEDGAPLPNPKVDLDRLGDGAGGAYVFLDGVMRFGPTAGALAAHRYTLGLAPERGVPPGRWVYPSDVVRARPDPKGLRTMRDGIKGVLIRGVALGPGAAPLRLRLRSGEDVALDVEIPTDQLQGEPAFLPLDHPLDADVERVVLELKSGPDSPFTLLQALELRERPPEKADEAESPPKPRKEAPEKKKKGKGQGKKGKAKDDNQ